MSLRILANCPICLFSSGTIANGKGTKCTTCNGSGVVSKTLYLKLQKQYGSLIPVIYQPKRQHLKN